MTRRPPNNKVQSRTKNFNNGELTVLIKTPGLRTDPSEKIAKGKGATPADLTRNYSIVKKDLILSLITGAGIMGLMLIIYFIFR